MSYYSNIWTHMAYLPPICGQKTGHCISRFHRSPSASMAFCAWQLQQLRRGNAYWVAFCCLTKGTWEVDQQSMGRNLQTWRCGVIWYNTTNGKRMPNKRGQNCDSWLQKLTNTYLGMWLGIFMDVITAKENIRWDRTLFSSVKYSPSCQATTTTSGRYPTNFLASSSFLKVMKAYPLPSPVLGDSHWVEYPAVIKHVWLGRPLLTRASVDRKFIELNDGFSSKLCLITRG